MSNDKIKDPSVSPNVYTGSSGKVIPGPCPPAYADMPTMVSVHAAEYDGKLFVSLWLPPGVTGSAGQSVGVLGFNEAVSGADHGAFLRSIGEVVVAMGKGERTLK